MRCGECWGEKAGVRLEAVRMGSTGWERAQHLLMGRKWS